MGASLIGRFGRDTPEGFACQQHLEGMATADAFQFVDCEIMKVLQSVPVPPEDWYPSEYTVFWLLSTSSPNLSHFHQCFAKLQ